MSATWSADAVLESIRAHLAELGFELVHFRRTGTLHRPIFQVRVDRPESRPGHGVTVGDCARISRSLEPMLERFLEASGAGGSRYVLEVSSPGLGSRDRGRAPDTGESDGRID